MKKKKEIKPGATTSNNKKGGNKKGKESSALIAASRARSVMDHVESRRRTGLNEDFSNTGTNDSYGEDL